MSKGLQYGILKLYNLTKHLERTVIPNIKTMNTLVPIERNSGKGPWLSGVLLVTLSDEILQTIQYRYWWKVSFILDDRDMTLSIFM